MENAVVNYEKFEENFRDIFNKYNNDIFFHNEIESDAFYSLIKYGIKSTDQDPNQEKINNKNLDEIFYSYLNEFYRQTNNEYFHFMFKFVILFRQSINRLKSPDTYNPPNPTNYFSQHNNAEGVPDMCNDFVTEFMEPKDYYGMDVMELIEVIQHLCYWLFIKNYTTSRLTLV